MVPLGTVERVERELGGGRMGGCGGSQSCMRMRIDRIDGLGWGCVKRRKLLPKQSLIG